MRPSTSLLLAPVVAVALLAPFGSASAAADAVPATPTAETSAGATDPSTPGADAPQSDLAVQVAKTAADLTEGTRALEQGQAHLADLQRRGADARAHAAQAAADAAQARAHLAALVGAAYRSPRADELALVLAGPNGLGDALRANASLEHVQGSQQEVAAEAESERTRADSLVREAARLEAEAATQESELAAQVAALQDQAQQAQDRLAAQAERAATADRASRDRTGAPGFVGAVSADCGGGTLTGFANGMLPASALCPLVGTAGLLLRADAAAAFNRMAAAGGMPCAGNSYRSYAEQVALYRQKPSLAAVPGTSNHGWGVAIDFACGADRFGSAAYQWLETNGPTYGWTHPSWADAGGSRPEPWHWEYTG